MTTQDVEELLATFVPPRDVTLVARGKSGYAATFYGSGAVTGNCRAQQFVTEAPRLNPNIWCVVERPQDLRAILGRAHDFGSEFKNFCSVANEEVNTYYSLQGEFLLVGDIVVGPLSMIPAESSWNRVFREICRIHRIENPTRPNLRQPLQSQLWSSLVELLAECADKIEFFGPPPPLSPPPSPQRRPVHPPTPAGPSSVPSLVSTDGNHAASIDGNNPATTTAGADDVVPLTSAPGASNAPSPSKRLSGSSKPKSDSAAAKRRKIHDGDDEVMDVTDEAGGDDFEDADDDTYRGQRRHALEIT
jgi:hypothetical protein